MLTVALLLLIISLAEASAVLLLLAAILVEVLLLRSTTTVLRVVPLLVVLLLLLLVLVLRLEATAATELARLERCCTGLEGLHVGTESALGVGVHVKLLLSLAREVLILSGRIVLP